jgi:hypothetical protein
LVLHANLDTAQSVLPSTLDWRNSSGAKGTIPTVIAGQTVLKSTANVNGQISASAVVSVDAHVEGIGWPGSLAGSVASMTLPSITYEFEQQLVFAPF